MGRKNGGAAGQHRQTPDAPVFLFIKLPFPPINTEEMVRKSVLFSKRQAW